MSRTRLAVAAFLFITLLPGCGILTGDRRTICDRWRDFWVGPQVDACPVSYPVADAGCATPIPTGAPYTGAPIYMGAPGASVPLGSETLPAPGLGAQPMPPLIPKAQIEEGKGKQFELEGASRKGGVGPALPMAGAK